MIAAVILASGYAKRMGRSKLTLELGGRTFLQRAIDAATDAPGLGRLVVVLRPEDAAPIEPGFLRDAVESHRAGTPPLPHPELVEGPPPRGREGTGRSGETDFTGSAEIEIVENPLAAEGQSAAVRLATAHLAGDPSCEAIVFAVVDQPFMESSVYRALLQAWAEGQGSILVSRYGDQRGSPVLFGRAYFAELQDITGDVGGREVMRRHPDAVHEVPMLNIRAGQDVDTWEDYQRARAEVAAGYS